MRCLRHVCDMTHPYVCHDASICVTQLIHICDMTCRVRDTIRVYECVMTCDMSCAWRMRHTCDMSYAWHDSCTRMRHDVWHVMCVMYASYMWHVVCVTWFVYVRDMMHSCVCEVFYSIKTCRAERQSRKRVAVWSTHKCEMTYVCVMTQVCNIALSCVCGMMWRKRMSTMGWPRWVGSLTL